jgi:hypothetical protein
VGVDEADPQYKNASKAIHSLEYAALWGKIGTITTEGGGGGGGGANRHPEPSRGGGGANIQIR